ncbi:hypothetical protein T4A_4363 [Trichinella pseudospiralis]|uniref:Uncharacterized protein n=1 Tax=Trichinella pseudospiralis TaxID=6337 RepID=A0A0V1F186_TRIPS|nr:hypothetical protein T4A_4363 [Trichinella pseudospiralis]KRZ42733.1 hypothetical protein T4C_5388 [Trichinella pseudospiralis]
MNGMGEKYFDVISEWICSFYSATSFYCNLIALFGRIKMRVAIAISIDLLCVYAILIRTKKYLEILIQKN